MTRTVALWLIGSVAFAAPVPKDASPHVKPANKNTVLKAHAGKLTLDASSTYTNYAVESLIDADEKSVWYSAGGDASVGGRQPWVTVKLPTAATVSRVTILGSRDASFPTGYFATEGLLELLDKDGKSLWKQTLTAAGAKYDFDADIGRVQDGVQTIKFTITKDEGKNNCVALSEILVE